jgi:hypothetical protein
VSIILTDGRLPGPSSFWWASIIPTFLVVGIRLRKRRPDSTPSWHHQIIPWTHASCGGVSAATGNCYVATYVTMGPQSISIPALPRRSLSSVLSTTIGGRAFKAPRKAEWPPAIVCLTPTTWHIGGLLPSFKLGVAVATIDVCSHTNWVRRDLHHSKLMTVFEIPSAIQSSFPLDLCDRVCASLQNLAR